MLTAHFLVPVLRRTSSVESQINSFISQLRNKRRSSKRRVLGRSRSDSDIKYAVYAAQEASGTTQYIKPDGEFNIKVVFKVRTQRPLSLLRASFVQWQDVIPVYLLCNTLGSSFDLFEGEHRQVGPSLSSSSVSDWYLVCWHWKGGRHGANYGHHHEVSPLKDQMVCFVHACLIL